MFKERNRKGLNEPILKYNNDYEPIEMFEFIAGMVHFLIIR